MLKEKNKCCGCRACECICPKKCIKMKEDSEGFIYPKVDLSLCIKCKKCEKVCPIIQNKSNLHISGYEQSCYLLVHNNNEVLKKSSSGGAFTAIVETFCDTEYVVFGCQMTEELKVCHGFKKSIDEIDVFRKSKYVQSDLKDTYVQVKDFLIKNKKVIFTGTPCQVEGLNKYLQKEYENLLTIDFVCHGVPSQKVFDKYVNYIEKKYNDRIKEVNFRKRIRYFSILDPFGINIKFISGKELNINSFFDYYMKGFLGALFYRPVCARCPFANLDRVSDITIADFWGIEKLHKDLNSNKGVSMILGNSKKSKKVIQKIAQNNDVRKVDIKYAKLENSNLNLPSDEHINRKLFYDNLDKKEFDKLIKDCMGKNNKIKVTFKALIPLKIKSILKNMMWS